MEMNLTQNFSTSLTPDEFLPAIGRWTILGRLVLLVAFGPAIALWKARKNQNYLLYSNKGI